MIVKIKKEKNMKKMWTVGCIAVFMLGLASLVVGQEYAAMQESPPQMEQVDKSVSDLFKVTELGGTDSDCQMIEDVTKGRFQELVPRFAGLPFSPGNKVVVIEISRQLVQPTEAELSRITDESLRQARSQTWRVRPLGVSIEQLAGVGRDGKLRLFRPYFSMLTKGGSVVRGRSVYSMKAAEVDVICRVTPRWPDKGNIIAFIKIAN